MCAAFQANGASVTLTVPAGRVATGNEVTAEYRLSSDVSVRRLPNVPMPGSKVIFGGMAVMRQWSHAIDTDRVKTIALLGCEHNIHRREIPSRV